MTEPVTIPNAETAQNLDQNTGGFLTRIGELTKVSDVIAHAYPDGNASVELEEFGEILNDAKLMDQLLNKGGFTQDQINNMSDEAFFAYEKYVDEKIRTEQRLPDDGFDYETGVSNKIMRYNLARLDTPSEKEMYLDNVVGAGNWGADNAGRYYLTANGLKIVGDQTELKEGEKGRIIDEKKPFTAADWAEFAAYTPQMIGGIGMSLRYSKFGFWPGVVMSGVGEAAGYIVDEIGEYIQGYSNQSFLPTQDGERSVLGSASENFAYGAGGETFGRFLRYFGRYLSDPQAGLFPFRSNAPLTEAGAQAIIKGNRAEILEAFPDLETKIKSVNPGASAEEIKILTDNAIDAMRTKILGFNIYKQPGKFDLFNPESNVKSKVTLQKQKAVNDVLEGNVEQGIEGGAPSITTSAGGYMAKILGRIQSVSEMMFGNSRDPVNKLFLQNSMLSLRARAAGYNDKEIYEMIVNYNLPKDSPLKLSDADFGRLINEKLGSQRMSFVKALQLADSDINNSLNVAIKSIEDMSTIDSKIMQEVSQNITSAKTLYNVNHASALNSIDGRAGVGLFDAQAIKMQIDEIIDLLPTKKINTTEQFFGGPGVGQQTRNVTKTVIDEDFIPKEVSSFLKVIQNSPDALKGADLGNIERIFSIISENPNVAKAIGFENIAKMNQAIDASYSSGIANARHLAVDLTDKNANGVVDDLVKVLETRAKVGKKVARIESDLFLKLAQEGSEDSLGMINGTSVWNTMIKNNKGKDLSKLINSLPAEKAASLKTDLSKITLNNIVENSRGINGEINVSKIVREWENLSPQIKLNIMPQGEVSNITFQMQKLKNLTGNLDEGAVEALKGKTGGEFYEVLINQIAKKNELDSFMASNWKKVLSDTTNLDYEKAIDYILKPKGSNVAKQVMAHFADDEVATAAIKQKVMEKILRATVNADDAFNIIYSGKALNQTLDNYGVEVLKSFFGKELTTDLFSFAKQLNILDKTGAQGGLVAANLALTPLNEGFKALPKLGKLGFISRILAMPGLLKYLTFGMGKGLGIGYGKVKFRLGREQLDALARVQAQVKASGALEETAGGDAGIKREPLGTETIKNIGETIEDKFENPDAVDIPYVPFVENRTGTIPEGSRMVKNMAPPLVDRPDTETLGKELFKNDITFAAQGGIMNAKKAFQRVA
jgi:hypothetical protein